ALCSSGWKCRPAPVSAASSRMGRTCSTAAAGQAARSARCGARSAPDHDTARPPADPAGRCCSSVPEHWPLCVRALLGNLTTERSNAMVDIIHRVGIKAPPAKVYAALSTIDGIAGWWTKETTGVSKPGGRIDLQFSGPNGQRIGGMNMEVMELDPDA